MKKLIRFGVSLDHHLLDDFDLHIKKRKYTNRSEALRDLIRDNLVATSSEKITLMVFVPNVPEPFELFTMAAISFGPVTSVKTVNVATVLVTALMELVMMTR